MTTDRDWTRLAHYVTGRRLELGYPRQEDLALAMPVSLRVVNNIENARKDAYSKGTMALLENALRWRPGSVESILSGSNPTPVNDKGAPEAGPDLRDETERKLWDALAAATPEERWAHIHLYRAQRGRSAG